MWGRERGDDMQQRATGRTWTQATAARTQPLYMGCALLWWANQRPVISFLNSRPATHTHTHTHAIRRLLDYRQDLYNSDLTKSILSRGLQLPCYYSDLNHHVVSQVAVFIYYYYNMVTNIINLLSNNSCLNDYMSKTIILSLLSKL